MIIDCHCHAGTGDGLTGPWDTRSSISTYLKRADSAGITHTVLFAVFNSDYRIANRDIHKIICQHPGRFTGFAFINSVQDKGREYDMVHEAVETFGFRGIKVHKHDGKISRTICEIARYYHIPVLYDIMGDTPAVQILANEYPDVNFIIPHLGSFADDWRSQTAFIDILARSSNIFTDTSGVRRFDLLLDSIRRAGTQKILFGTDGAWLHPALELYKIKLLHLSKEDYFNVTAGNIKRLLNNNS
jgi:predicted TIM-barrel fold metal-dependent hydrolase